MTPERKANLLGIPPERRNHPMVNEFLDLDARLHNLRFDLTVASDRNQYGMASLGRQREDFNSPDMVLPLEQRYRAGLELLNAAIFLMEEGMGEHPADKYKRFVMTRINRVLEPLGMQVVRQEPVEPKP